MRNSRRARHPAGGHGVLVGLCVAGLLGCRPDPVPLDHTSLSIRAGDDPGKPDRRVSLLWVHGGAADTLLSRGLAAELSANNIVLRQIRAGQGKLGAYVVGDHVTPGDWPGLFTDPERLSRLVGWQHPGGGSHDIVVFGGGPEVATIDNEQTVGRYQGWYRDLVRAFRSHPRTLFVPLTPPPLTARETTPAAASRARRFSRWLRQRYAPKQVNVVAFDLFATLAIREGKPKANTLVPQFGSGSGAEVSRVGAKAVGRMMIPFLNRQIERLALGEGRSRLSREGPARRRDDWRRSDKRSAAAEAKRLERAKRQRNEASTLPARPARSVGETYYPARPARTFDPPIPPRRPKPKQSNEDV